jgi:hypothetical protein
MDLILFSGVRAAKLHGITALRRKNRQGLQNLQGKRGNTVIIARLCGARFD